MVISGSRRDLIVYCSFFVSSEPGQVVSIKKHLVSLLNLPSRPAAAARPRADFGPLDVRITGDLPGGRPLYLGSFFRPLCRSSSELRSSSLLSATASSSSGLKRPFLRMGRSDLAASPLLALRELFPDDIDERCIETVRLVSDRR